MYPAIPDVASPVCNLMCPDVPLLPASAVVMEIWPELAACAAPLASSMLPPVAAIGLSKRDMAVVDPDNNLISPPSPSSPTPTLIYMLPPRPVFDVHGSGFPM